MIRLSWPSAFPEGTAPLQSNQRFNLYPQRFPLLNCSGVESQIPGNHPQYVEHDTVVGLLHRCEGVADL